MRRCASTLLRLQNDVRGAKAQHPDRQLHLHQLYHPPKPQTIAHHSTMSSPLHEKTIPLYQKDGQLHTHTNTITSIQALSSLPPSTQALFKPPPDTTPYILTTPSTIFHAQGGGQPTDTGTIVSLTPENRATFHVHQVRQLAPAILHMGVFDPPDEQFARDEKVQQNIDVAKRLLHSRIHTAGHVIGLAINHLVKQKQLPSDILDGKASHYPNAAFVEFSGVIPSTAKSMIQDTVDALVAQDLVVSIHFWDEETARRDCTGVLDTVKGDEDGVRVVQIGNVGSYPCGGTHVRRLSECGKVVVRGVKRQKGVSKVGYEVQDA